MDGQMGEQTDKQKVLTKLIWDLQAFLAVLDKENLSYIAQAQKESISELLTRLQPRDGPAVEDAEYMIMSCPSGSPSNNTPGTDDPPVDSTHSKDPSSISAPQPQRASQGPVIPPLPPGGLDEDCYEEAEPFIPEMPAPSADQLDSESSHYESYGEEEEEEEGDEEAFVKDRAHYIQWSASQPCLRPAPESTICGYLWRKRWLGQWSRQLFLIRNNILMCYKCAKDLHPQLELDLRGCQVTYRSKHSSRRKMQYEVKVVAGSQTLVIGFYSCQQAEDWRKIIEEVSGSIYCELEPHSSSSLLKSGTIQSSRSSTILHTDSEEEETQSAIRPSSSSFIALDKGYLNVLMNCQWQSLQCRVEAGQLRMFGEEGVGGAPQYTVQLRGCEVQPGPETAQSYRITLSQHGDPVVVLEASCSDEKEHWLQLLQDQAVNQSLRDNGPLDQPAPCLSLLKNRTFPDSNMYMTEPFPQLGGTAQPIYCNSSSILEHMFSSSQNVVSSNDSVTYSNTISTNHSRKLCEVQRGVLKLELTSGRSRVPLRAGSETHLASPEKGNKRSSFRQSLAFCTERAQGGFLSPLLRRTASAKNSLKRAPSALLLQHGKVFQRRKEWETKAAT